MCSRGYYNVMSQVFNYYTCFSIHGKLEMRHFSKWKQQKTESSGNLVACGLLLHGFFLLLLSAQASPVTLREARAGPKFNECMRHIFAERAWTAPLNPSTPPTPHPPSSPYIQLFFFSPLLLKRTPCRPRLSQRLQRKYIMCKKNSIWCHTICVILSQLIKKKSPCMHNSVLCERNCSLCTVCTALLHLVNFFQTGFPPFMIHYTANNVWGFYLNLLID